MVRRPMHPPATFAAIRRAGCDAGGVARRGAVRIAAAARRGWWLAAALLAASAAPQALAADAGRVPRPVVSIAQSGQCVADTEFMRRNHMNLLKHDRDLTVRSGVRKVQASLKGCVDCHASSATGAVNAAPDDFCASCHAYAGVTLDCFECHSGRKAAAAEVRR